MKYPEDYINKVICGDCLEVMKGIPDNSIDLVVTDPPFNSEKKMGSPFRSTSKNKLSEVEWFIYDKMSGRGYLRWLNMILKEIYRVGKEGSHIYMFSNWKSLRNLMDSLEITLFTLNDVLTWDKKQFGIGFNYRPQTEFIIFASKNKAKPLNSKDVPNIFRIKRVSNLDMNTLVQKPVELIKRLLSKASKENHIVLDPFLGSGTTAVTCKQLNRNFIGIEINPEYCKIAEERLRKVPERLDKFVEAVK